MQMIMIQRFTSTTTSAWSTSRVYRLEIEHQRESRRAWVGREMLSAESGPLFEFVQGEVRLYRDDHSEGPTFRSDWTESALARWQLHGLVSKRHPGAPRSAEPLF